MLRMGDDLAFQLAPLVAHPSIVATAAVPGVISRPTIERGCYETMTPR